MAPLGKLQQLLFTALAALLASTACWADPPGRVGRISYLAGTVSIQSVDAPDWVPVTLNWPVTSGDVLWTGPGDRSEIRVGSTALRLDGSTELQIVQLDDRVFRVRLLRGSVAAHLVNPMMADEFELATDHGRTEDVDPGSYRFDYGDATTAVTAFRGALHFVGNGQDYFVSAGQRAEFWYSGDLSMQLSAPVADDFSDWMLARDRRDDQYGRARYVSAEMTGYEDLDAYGDWRPTDEYGVIWVPRVVPVGWSPYRSGHWAWIAPWGWTWIDDAPWGFAPFHYGRWLYWHGSWAWTPGAYAPMPTYAPALVAWVGQPGAVGVVAATPNVGWFPLGPREPFYPWYQSSVTYVRQVNVTVVKNVTVINSVQPPAATVQYVNRNIPQAVTVVPANVLTQGRPVDKHRVRDVDAREIARLPISHEPPVALHERDFGHREGRRPGSVVAPPPTPPAARALGVAPAPLVSPGRAPAIDQARRVPPLLVPAERAESADMPRLRRTEPAAPPSAPPAGRTSGMSPAPFVSPDRQPALDQARRTPAAVPERNESADMPRFRRAESPRPAELAPPAASPRAVQNAPTAQPQRREREAMPATVAEPRPPRRDQAELRRFTPAEAAKVRPVPPPAFQQAERRQERRIDAPHPAAKATEAPHKAERAEKPQHPAKAEHKQVQ